MLQDDTKNTLITNKDIPMAVPTVVPTTSTFLTDYGYTYPSSISRMFAPNTDIGSYIQPTMKQVSAIPTTIMSGVSDVLNQLNKINTAPDLTWNDKLTRKYLTMQLGHLLGAIPSTYGFATGLGQLGLLEAKTPYDIFKDYAGGYSTIQSAFIHPNLLEEFKNWANKMNNSSNTAAQEEEGK